MFWNRCLFCIILLVLMMETDVRAAWNYPRKKPRHHAAVKYQNDATSYGPNVCAIQEVFRTGEKLSPDCVKKRLKKICGRPTLVRYECCCGYRMVSGEDGCPALDPVMNLREKLLDLDLKQFTKLLTNTEIESDLMLRGAFTVFAPVDEAFNDLTQDQKQRLFPWTYNALSLVHYHISPGWHHTDHMKKNEFLPTLYYGLKPVWTNKLSKNGVQTVNCARIIKSNILATNGVIHLIDQVLSPYDMFGNLTEVIFRESDQFSQFIQVMYTSQLVNMLREGGTFTVFAPNNYAFSRIPKSLLDKMLQDPETAAAVVRHHTASGLHCSTANIVDTKLRMLDGTYKKFQCKSSGHYWENSKVVQRDMIAGNGVVHIVNKIQLPNSVQNLEGLARALRLDKFLQLLYEAGLLDQLQHGPEMTLFIPADKAFSEFFKKRRNSMIAEPFDIEKMFDYHSTIGKFTTDTFVGGSSIVVNAGKYLKTTIHRNGILVDDAEIILADQECYNGVIHVIDKVLEEPAHDSMTLIEAADELSIFKKGLEYSGLSDKLASSESSFTVFGPTDQAFARMDKSEFDKIFDDEKQVQKELASRSHSVRYGMYGFEIQFLQDYIVEQIIISRSIPPDSMIQVTTLNDNVITLQRDDIDNFTINKRSGVLEHDIIAKNGVLYKIDRILQYKDIWSTKADEKPGR